MDKQDHALSQADALTKKSIYVYTANLMDLNLKGCRGITVRLVKTS